MWKILLLSLLLGCTRVDVTIFDKSPNASKEQAETDVINADPSMISIEGSATPTAETENKKAGAVKKKGGKNESKRKAR